ncbi:MAG TPA: Gfo/Idh/MocA family oxidoreductase [Dermatophilaceae bacterium]|nr:Gfo/Idh/MocA family oxidoreductase [Dermatophilaceae bacterium]
MTSGSVNTVGLAGFGSAGRGIHAPLLRQAGMTIGAVSTADPQRAEQVRREVPGARVVADLDALLAMAGLDLIVLATPSGLHAPQARQCIDAGIAVVVDKPLATDATQAFRVVDASRAAGVALTVFQNRRFDAEHVAARETVASGLLGEVFRHEFRWERWRPTPKDRWRENASAAEGGGILLDLHSHMIDAAVDLFGPIDTVYAEVAARTTAAEDDAFLACRHTSGVVSHLGATSVSAAPGPRVRILGMGGAFLLNQFEDDGAGIYPDLADADAAQCGWVYAGAQRTPVTRPAAGQADFYRQVKRALGTADPQAAMPVDPYDAVHTLAVIDAARASAASGTVVQVRTPGRR